MTALSTSMGTFAPRRTSGSEHFAAVMMGAMFLLATSGGANATGNVVTTQQQRVHFLGTGSRDTALRSDAKAVVSTFNAQDHIVTELARLVNGWGGPETLAPSASIQNDVGRVVSMLNISTDTMPEVHIDDDGATSLIWANDGSHLLSLEFFGKGYVACAFSHEDQTKCLFEKIDISDEIGLAGFLETAAANGADFNLA